MLLVAMTSMQLGAAFAKNLFVTVGAQGATALRLGFSAVFLAAARRPWRRISPNRLSASLVFYGLSLGAMNTLFYLALRTTPLGIAVALEFIGPLSLALVSSRRWLDFVWIAFAAAGLLCLAPVRRSATAIDPTGALLALGSGAFWALYIVFGRRVGRAFGGDGVALGMLIAAAVFVPFGAIQAGSRLLDLAILPGGLLLALLSSAVPYSLELAALSRMPTRLFGTLMSLEPAVGALAGLLVLGERPSALEWSGIVAIVIASLGAALTLGPRPAA
jgi:inner membrane transporter RhtA